MKRIFVGGLSAETNEEDLREYFEQFGIVSAESGGHSSGKWICVTSHSYRREGRREDIEHMYTQQP